MSFFSKKEKKKKNNENKSIRQHFAFPFFRFSSRASVKNQEAWRRGEELWRRNEFGRGACIMDSRCMSMRFPVLDRIKMSAALPHPAFPLFLIPSQKRTTRDAGVFPVLNNFKSHRPTDSYPRLHRSSTAFTTISTNSQIRDGFRETSISLLEKYIPTIHREETERSFDDLQNHSSTSFAFVSRNCRSGEIAIGPNSGEISV